MARRRRATSSSRAASPTCGARATRSVLQRCAERIEEMAGAVLARPRVVIAIEECALLGDFQGGLSAIGLQLHGRERHGDLLVVKVHHVRVDEPFVWNHALISAVEAGTDAASPTALHPPTPPPPP